MKHLKASFYFDYLSPFSFFFWKRLKEQHFWSDKVEFTLRPIILKKILDHWGQKGPGEIAPKRDYIFRYLQRLARKGNDKIVAPPEHPFNSLYAQRVSLVEVSGERQREVIDFLWSLCWECGSDLADPDFLERQLEKQFGKEGISMWEKSFSRSSKEAIRRNTTDAIAEGVFGVPTVVFSRSGQNPGELFWGLDSMDDLRFWIDEQLAHMSRKNY